MRQTGWRALLKRGVDLAGASTALGLLWPLMAGAGLAVWGTMGRPVLFKQQRPGYKGRPFYIYKFRTMREPRPGEVWFRTDEQRLTRLGRFLRKTSIDELPELYNVLRGEMSLVGPRPLLMEYLDKYTPDEARRHDVKPGITGWAAVNGRQDLAFSQRLALDVWYVDHWRLGLDFVIMLKTASAVLNAAGVRSGQNVDVVDDIGLSSDRARQTPAQVESHDSQAG